MHTCGKEKKLCMFCMVMYEYNLTIDLSQNMAKLTKCCAFSKDSDETAHLLSLIRVIAGHFVASFFMQTGKTLTRLWGWTN